MNGALPRRSLLGSVSRALLYPGPAPPLSHLGATLLRHVVVTGLRFTFYQLGLPSPERPPIRIHRLRLYLDGSALASGLGDHPAAGSLTGALVDPGGIAEFPSLERRLAGAALFHRLRLLLPLRRRISGRRSRRSRETPWQAFRHELSRLLPALSDAFLAEVLAALAHQPLPPRHRLRGRFREHYRAALERLRPPFVALAEEAANRGLLEQPEEAFFLPFDLAADLENPAKPGWLAPALTANRREFEGLLQTPSPPEILADRRPPDPEAGQPDSWSWQPLAPLP